MVSLSLRSSPKMFARVLMVFVAITLQPSIAQESEEYSDPNYAVALVSEPSGMRFFEAGPTELMKAAKTGDVRQAKVLVEAGSDLDAQNRSGLTALFIAAIARQYDMGEWLLDAGADPNVVAGNGATVLTFAISVGADDWVRLLLARGSNPDVDRSIHFGKNAHSALAFAAAAGSLDVVTALIEEGADLKKDGPEALNFAVWNSHVEVAELLLGRGIDINARWTRSRRSIQPQPAVTVLQTAAQRGWNRFVEDLLARGAKVNAIGRNGHTALYYATIGGHLGTAKLLLHSGATVTKAILAEALRLGQADMIEYLLSATDLRYFTNEEVRALVEIADTHGAKDVAKRLVVAKPRLYAKSDGEALLLSVYEVGGRCHVATFNPSTGQSNILRVTTDRCDTRYSYSAEHKSVLSIDADQLISIPLSGDGVSLTVQLPHDLIEEDTEQLTERLAKAYGDNFGGSVKLKAHRAGYLSDGTLALVVHAQGIADETYGFLYALTEANWQRFREQDCHRFDSVCGFDEMSGAALSPRSSGAPLWGELIRQHPLYSSAQPETPHPTYEQTMLGAVDFLIDGRKVSIRYEKRLSGHCTEECDSSHRVTVENESQPERILLDRHGYCSLVDQYLLFESHNQSWVVDIGNGESVIDGLRLATWIY